MSRTVRQLLVLVAVMGCADDPTAPTPVSQPTRNTVAILPDTFTATSVLHLMDTVRLTAARRDSSGAAIAGDAARFLWESSDTTILYVFPDGLVRVVGLGTATVRARVADSLVPELPSPVDTASGALTLRSSYTVVDPGPIAFAALEREHQCIIRAAGQLYCRGRNDRGQVGIGSISTTAVADWTLVASDAQFTSVSTSLSHTCALATDGRAFCWGSNFSAQQGNGTTQPRTFPTPTELPGGLRWRNIKADGHAQTCGATVENIPYCVGHNDWGQIGREPRVSIDSAFAPIQGDHRMSILLTDEFLTCGLELDGSVYCAGESGPQSNSTGANSGIARRIGGSVTFTSIVIGDSHGCGLDAARQAWCWGENNFGYLGTGDIESSGTARAVAGGHSFEKLFAFDYGTCGLTAAGEAYCWGYNSSGSSGRVNIRFVAEPTLVNVGGGLTWIGPTRNQQGLCAINASSQLICWGGGY